MKTILTFFSITLFTLVGLWAQTQSNPLYFSSWDRKMIQLHPTVVNTTTNFYGLGLDPGKLRFQVAYSSSGSNSFGFYNGYNTEIVELNTNASLVLKGNDPDISMNMPSSSSNALIQLRFQVNNSTRAELRYDRFDDQVITTQGNDHVLTLDHNETDYWVTVRRGLRAWKLKTDATLVDYVFQPDYAPMPLAEVEQYVWQHHHLPGVISQAEVDEAGGVELTAFTIQLQEKLEELYLHTIEQEKRISELERRLAEETEISERAEKTEGAEISEIAEKTEGAEISETPEVASPQPTPAQPQEQK